MQKVYKNLATHKLAYLGLIILLFLYISASRSSVLTNFFTGNSSHHCCHGMDFYQVPNGAYAFLHGGSLTGKPLSDGSVYAKGYFVNQNVYHPFFTVVLGSWLIQFSPAQSFFAWLFLKLSLTLIAISYFFWTFRTSKYISFAVFVLAANVTQYLDIIIGQFQGILNVFFLLLLINLVKKQDKMWGSVLYCLTLLVKPIGILWLWMFLWKQHFKVGLFGCILFAGCTIPFLFSGAASYYTTNLLTHYLSPSNDGPNQIITLLALLRYTTHWSDIVLKSIQGGVLVLVLFFSSLKRIHVSKGIFLTVVYYLFFYDFVFEYHYTTLAPIIAVCIVCCPEFQTRFSRFCALLTCLPSAFILLNYWHINVTFDKFYGPNPGAFGWELMVVSKIVPVILLLVSVLVPDIVPIYTQVKAFWLALRKVNREMEVFG